MFGSRFEIPHTVGEEEFTVIMRGQQEGDAEALARMICDYHVQQFILTASSPGVKGEEEWLEKVRTDPGSAHWLISIAKDGNEELVGTTGLNPVWNNFLSSGIVLVNKEWWNKGIAGLTHQIRTWYAFRERGAYAIRSGYLTNNDASGKALRSVGYVDCGQFWNVLLTAGVFRDERLMICYNPDTAALLWPDGDIPDKVARGMEKTSQVFEWAEGIIKPR